MDLRYTPVPQMGTVEPGDVRRPLCRKEYGMSDNQGDNQRDDLDELASDQKQEAADEFTLEAF